ncbi:cytochrome P450 monooxygenase pc-bph, partial [Amylostereum chailletii]
MNVIQQISSLPRLDNLFYLAAAITVVVLAIHIIPWILDSRGIRAYPGPWLAKFSDLWLTWTVLQGHRSEVVHELHKKYGAFLVRIAPNHISISDHNALEVVYAHGNRATKTEFYDAFATTGHGLFSVRDRAAHSRKRKIVSHIFAPKAVLEFEPHVEEHLTTLIQQWDRMCEGGVKGMEGEEGEGWKGRDGRVWFNCLAWFGFLAFDMIGDLSFGSSFGMLVAAKDSAPIAKSYKEVMQTFDHVEEGKAVTSEEFGDTPAVKFLRERGGYTATMGTIPSSWRPFAKYIPAISRGKKALKSLAGVGVAAVAKRLSTPSYSVDFLAKLLEGRDDSGAPLGPVELTSEALTLLLGGSATTTNTLTSIAYYLAANPHCQKILQKELDEALAGEDVLVYSHVAVKHLRYLDAVINESMRMHSLVGMGLPREVPDGGMVVLGKFFPEGTVLSVPSYSVHHDASVWGDDVEVFKPERWLEDHHAHAKAFYPFSFGPRVCVGRNLVAMEMPIFIASLFRRYEFVLD